MSLFETFQTAILTPRIASPRRALHGVRLALFAAFAASAVACGVRGLGDPCIPEDMPDGGYSQRESYVESNSAQCRTRVCLVFKLNGNPYNVRDYTLPDDPSLFPAECDTDPTLPQCEDPRDSCGPGDTNCVVRYATPNSIAFPNSEERIFCSCRCSAVEGAASATPLCECDDGWHCVDVVDSGPDQLRGGYCVPSELCIRDGDCSSGQCDQSTNTCL